MPHPRSTGPAQDHAFENGPRITALETVIPSQVMPGLLALRIHTDADPVDGQAVIGQGETYYIPEAVAAVIHDWMGQRLIGASATAVESHWRFLYERATAFGGTGAELRALSAIDLALWDILGQLLGRPVWQLFGGPVRSSIPVYNSCGGPYYGGVDHSQPRRPSWPGHGDGGKPGPLEDNWKGINEPAELAVELLDAGYRAMKLWSFDAIFRESGGGRLSPEQVRRGVAPFLKIREAIGDQMDLMLDGHGFFSLTAGLQIARAMREVQPLWMEDIVRPDNLETIAQFRQEAGAPVAVSEMLILREHYRRILELKGADFVMIDPTWVGGLSETRRIAELAQLFNVSVLMHDCTGPFTLLSGLNIAASNTAVCYQETVRAHIATIYPHLIDRSIVIQDGQAEIPQAAGIGARWLESLFDRNNASYRWTDN